MMTEQYNLVAVTRTEHGKGASHRLRKSGLAPAVLYSKGQQAISLAVSPRDTAKILLGPKRRNVVINLAINDQAGTTTASKHVMVRDLQVDPILRTLTHADFIEIDENKPVKARIPLLLSGKNEFVVQGGKLEQVSKSVMVSALPRAIPVNVTFDITSAHYGSTFVSAIPFPAGVSLAENPKNVLITIKQPKAEKETEATAAATPAAAPAKAEPAKK